MAEVMRRKWRFGIHAKISLGFSILVAMLFISGLLSIYALISLGRDIRVLLDDSYRSVSYSHGMLLALERQRHALLLSLSDVAGVTASDSAKMVSAREDFLSNLSLANSNLTHPGEDVYVDSISFYYARYCEASDSILDGGDYGYDYFVRHVMPLDSAVSFFLSRLLALNQDGLYASVSSLEEAPHRALRPGLIVVIVSVFFTLMFSYFIRYFYVLPLRKIRSSILHFLKLGRYSPVSLSSRDELLELRDAVDQLVSVSRSRGGVDNREAER